MINRRRCFLPGFAILLLALILSGCVDSVKNMRVVPADQIIAVPEKGKSMVVFIRPSSFGVTIESSIFEIKRDTPSLVGTLVAKQKLFYQLEPGKHLFMVAANNIDYLPAELKANKTYYVQVAPIMGKWIGRFKFTPMPINELYSSRFNEWLKECEWVEKIPVSNGLENSDMAGIPSKHKAYYAKWASEDLSRKPRLLPRDGK